MKRTANAVWKGKGTEGSGLLTTQSGALKEQPYSIKLRFENEDGKLGTNPEELIAAAHAGCFAMALSVQLEKAGYSADKLNADAALTLNKNDRGWAIEKIALTLDAKVPKISVSEFGKLATAAKEGCPVSNVLSCEITLEYSFTN
ncbi:MAG: OsmC family protein [Balneolaceae bacterium]